MASAAAVVTASPSPGAAARLPLCAHCGLPVAGAKVRATPLYCCTGCALAHRITGGDAGHGVATGMLMAVGVGAFLAMNVMMLSFVLYSGRGEADRLAGEAWVRWALLLLATPALVLLGAPFLTRGVRRLREGTLDTDALIVLGVSAAFSISVASVLRGEGPLYLDTAMGILLFVTIGRYLEAASRARATDALSALAQRMPRDARRIGADGAETEVAIEELRVGDHVRVRPGEAMPADGVIVEGEASCSQADLTGEPLPERRGPGDTVAACSVNLDGSLRVEVRRTGADTTIARLVRLVDEARAGRFPLMPLVDRVSAVFVPLVLSVAAATLTFWWWKVGFGVGLLNALCVLLIACPCAIGIATPLASTAAAGRAAAAGVLVKSGEVFERLARARLAFFDKTGTLTLGTPRLIAIHTPACVGGDGGLGAEELRSRRSPDGGSRRESIPSLGPLGAVASLRPPDPGTGGGFTPPSEPDDDLLSLAAAVEAHSEHPLARAITAAAAARALPRPEVTAFAATPGRGVTGVVDGRTVRVGSAAFTGVAAREAAPGASLVHVSRDGVALGTLELRDEPRPTSLAALAGLRGLGLEVELLSGDQPASVAAFAATLPGVRARGGLLPEDKLQVLRDAVAAGDTPLMVGDGLNDVPALSGAAVGVTLESGTDLAREVADVTVLGGDLRRLPWLVGLARRTLRTARINLFWAFFYNLVGVGLAVTGLLHPLFGAVAMIVSSLLVVLHSQRLGAHALPLEPGP
ncbi:MAG: cation-translocating P-type ATPase [Vicinamibacteria bacterium]|nr:cation-translocating P-type ATPase [Vicinamibacteria bacterium]